MKYIVEYYTEEGGRWEEDERFNDKTDAVVHAIRDFGRFHIKHRVIEVHYET